MARKTPLQDTKILYGLAASRCSFTQCRKELVLESSVGAGKKQIGKIAHIVAHSMDGPRGDCDYKGDRDTYDNWILLCPNHHDEVDVLSSDYTVKDLRKMKACHEAWVRNSLEDNVPLIGFAELEIAASAIISSTPMEGEISFEVLPPAEKIQKNLLTAPTHHLIAMGLSRSREVGGYIEGQSKFDDSYPDRLKKGFREEYDKLSEGGLCGDALFEAMLDFSSGSSPNFKRRAAGLAILSHLFEICEVFEK